MGCRRSGRGIFLVEYCNLIVLIVETWHKYSKVLIKVTGESVSKKMTTFRRFCQWTVVSQTLLDVFTDNKSDPLQVQFN
jgi:hypothetical protein